VGGDFTYIRSVPHQLERTFSRNEQRGAQLPHDAAPGAFIGLALGAHFVDLAGEPISTDDLAESLMQPSGAALQYVLAAGEDIANELSVALGSSRMFYTCPLDCGRPGKVALKSGGPPLCDNCQRKMVAHDRRAVGLVVGM